MRHFWGNQFDFNDRNDFPAGNRFTGAAANPRPATPGGGFAFGDVNDDRRRHRWPSGRCWPRSRTARGLHRFSIAIAQDLCFWANSAPCSETDPEFRRVVAAFENSTRRLQLRGADQGVLRVAAGDGRGRTAPFRAPTRCRSASRAAIISAPRCPTGWASPTCARRRCRCRASTQTATATIATSVAADAFSRGSQIPVTPSDPTLFYRSATELLCSNIAAQVVDPTAGGGVYTRATSRARSTTWSRR